MTAPVRIVLAVAALALLGACRRDLPIIQVTNVTEVERLSIGKIASQGPIRSLRLTIEGRIDGNAQLVLLADNQPVQVFDLSGDVEQRWSGAWTEDRARLAYTPGTVTGGALRVRYQFVD